MSAGAPPPPWHSEVEALLWWSPAAVLAGLVAYRRGPVGPYGELFAAVPVVRGARILGTVAFMAVDSEASVAGGRGNWALPKELARFERAAGRTGGVVARGEGWSAVVSARVRARALPVRLAAACAQVWPDAVERSFAVRLRGRLRLATVEVEPSATLPRWLAPGRHAGVLVSGAQDVAAPRPR